MAVPWVVSGNDTFLPMPSLYKEVRVHGFHWPLHPLQATATALRSGPSKVG